MLESGPDAKSSPKWFAVYTVPRHEKRVDFHLNQRAIDHYLPLYRTRRKWADGSWAKLDLPLFPSYIFVHIQAAERARVLAVPGVLAIVGGTAREPAPLPDSEIDALRLGLHYRCAEPHPLLLDGQRVRVRAGAIAGMEGILVRQKSGLRVVFTMSLISQSIAVDVEETELEQVSRGVCSYEMCSTS